MPKPKTFRTDILVIGSGIAGLYFALQAAEHSKVMIVTKKELMESNSNYAQGGIAAVLDPLDKFTAHIKDTMQAGGQINNRAAVELMVKEAPRHIHALIDLGVGFNHTATSIDLTQEGGHSKRRIVHSKDATGKEVERALLFAIRQHPNITTFESHYAIDLLKTAKNNQVYGQVYGADIFNRETNTLERYTANCVVLATGGSGQVYEKTSNPKIATGDGVAMAQRAGAILNDMEFIQFHPTTLQLSGKPHFLLSEALRGEGAYLRNHAGKRFMARQIKQKELAPRDIVSQAVFAQMAHGPVYLDITHKPSAYIKARFPYIYNQLWWYGLKLDTQPIPISPAAHYMCGGVRTDLWGRTSLPGLYAIGETANTGVHGANRLASNSILECLVFADRAQQAIARDRKKLRVNASRAVQPRTLTFTKATSASYRWRKQIQHIMWKYAGIVRTPHGLQRAHQRLTSIAELIAQQRLNKTSIVLEETRNLCATALAIVEAAQARPNSIGSHYMVSDEYA